MPRLDPWEQKEHDRLRWQRHGRTPSKRSDVSGPVVTTFGVLVGLLLILHLIGDMPSISQSMRYITLMVSVVGWVALITWKLPSKSYILGNLHRPTSIVLVSLGLWISWRSFGTLFPVQALGGWLKLMAALSAFWVGMYCTGTLRERFTLLCFSGGILLFVAFIDIGRYGLKSADARSAAFHPSSVSMFGTHEAIGTLLAFALPIGLAFATTRRSTGSVRLVAGLVTTILTFAWILARCRSGWVGGVAGCLTIGLIEWISAQRNQRPVLHQRRFERILTSPWMWLTATSLIVLAYSGLTAIVLARMGGLGAWWSLASVAARSTLWKTAAYMINEKPWMGWGTSGFLTQQGMFSHTGDAPWQVRLNGGSLADNAHSFPLQFLVDFGYIGFGLVVTILGMLTVRSLRNCITSNTDESIWHQAALGAITAAIITSIASPAFDIAGIAVWFSLILGVLLGRCGGDVQKSRVDSLYVTLVTVLFLLPVGGLLMALSVQKVKHTIRLEPQVAILQPRSRVVLKLLSSTDGKTDSSFPGGVFSIPEVAVIGKNGRIKRVLSIAKDAVLWTYVRRSNTEADAVLEFELPEVATDPGETLEVGVAANITYIDGSHCETGISLPIRL